MSIRDKMNPKETTPRALVGDVLETYGVATVISGVLGCVYFFVIDPSFSFTLAVIADGVFFVCLLFSLVWLGHFGLGSINHPEAYEKLDPPDPLQIHQLRLKLARKFAPFIPKKK